MPPGPAAAPGPRDALVPPGQAGPDRGKALAWPSGPSVQVSVAPAGRGGALSTVTIQAQQCLEGVWSVSRVNSFLPPTCLVSAGLLGPRGRAGRGTRPGGRGPHPACGAASPVDVGGCSPIVPRPMSGPPAGHWGSVSCTSPERASFQSASLALLPRPCVALRADERAPGLLQRDPPHPQALGRGGHHVRKVPSGPAPSRLSCRARPAPGLWPG